MRYCFHARAGEIDIPECFLIQDTKVLTAFRGDIDVPGRGERC